MWQQRFKCTLEKPILPSSSISISKGLWVSRLLAFSQDSESFRLKYFLSLSLSLSHTNTQSCFCFPVYRSVMHVKHLPPPELHRVLYCEKQQGYIICICQSALSEFYISAHISYCNGKKTLQIIIKEIKGKGDSPQDVNIWMPSVSVLTFKYS